MIFYWAKIEQMGHGARGVGEIATLPFAPAAVRVTCFRPDDPMATMPRRSPRFC